MAEKTCKVFTPPEIVSYMLDKIGYVNHLYGKKILENSCGTGRFLCEIIKRYILDGRRTEKTDVEIKGGLERDITGIEKEPDIYKECWDNLDRTAMELGIQDVQWNILIGDALKSNVDPIYQFVVGNPPYVTYYNLSIRPR
nr:N-6 DNA methylase [uncultured Acetatifactor sp.]